MSGFADKKMKLGMRRKSKDRTKDLILELLSKLKVADGCVVLNKGSSSSPPKAVPPINHAKLALPQPHELTNRQPRMIKQSERAGVKLIPENSHSRLPPLQQDNKKFIEMAREQEAKKARRNKVHQDIQEKKK